MNLNKRIGKSVDIFISNRKKISGYKISEDEICRIESSLSIKLPKWYKDMFTEKEIIGLPFYYNQNKEREDWFDEYMEIANPLDIIKDSTEYYPGCEVIKSGFVLFANHLVGGDYYYLDLKDPDKTSIYQFYHDFSEDYLLSEGFEIIADNLEELFIYSISNSDK